MKIYFLVGLGAVLTTLAGEIPRYESKPIQPYQAQTIQAIQSKQAEAIQSKTIQPYTTKPIEPISSGPIQPIQGATIQPLQGTRITNRVTDTIEPCLGGRTIQPLNPAGMDPVKDPRPLDPALIGAWDVSIPAVAYQTEVDRGSHLERALHTGLGAAMGILTIHPDGSFVWTKNGLPQNGKLLQVIPHNYADPKRTYWRVQHGKDVYYIASETPGEIALYSPGTNLFAAAGKRRKS